MLRCGTTCHTSWYFGSPYLLHVVGAGGQSLAEPFRPGGMGIPQFGICGLQLPAIESLDLCLWWMVVDMVLLLTLRQWHQRVPQTAFSRLDSRLLVWGLLLPRVLGGLDLLLAGVGRRGWAMELVLQDHLPECRHLCGKLRVVLGGATHPLRASVVRIEAAFEAAERRVLTRSTIRR